MALQSNQMTGAQKRALRTQARSTHPKILVGRNGITDKIVQELKDLLERENLVKVRFAAKKDEKQKLSQQLAESASALILDQIGHVVIYFSPKEDAKSV